MHYHIYRLIYIFINTFSHIYSHIYSYIYSHIYIYIWEVEGGVMVIIIGKGNRDPSSNPGPGY